MNKWMITILWIGLVLAMQGTVFSQQAESDLTKDVVTKKELTLSDAAMCEEIKDYVPYNRSVIFSTSLGKVICYTLFDPVPQKTVIYHNWFRKDVLSTSIKLELHPPRWASYSTIQLREADKGPWRVEITGADGEIMNTLRFSIAD